MSMIIVNNHTQRIIGYPQPIAQGSNVSEMVRLMPGPNRIEADSFKLFRDSVLFKALQAQSDVEVIEAGDLAGLDAVKAKLLVDECVSLSTLEGWGETEKRKEIKKAIDARVKALEKALSTEEDA